MRAAKHSSPWQKNLEKVIQMEMNKYNSSIELGMDLVSLGYIPKAKHLKLRGRGRIIDI